jgi:hypothetical protein
MKVYQVVRRGSKWHVLMPDAGAAIEPSEDKSKLVAWAREAAKQHDGAVHVRDLGGRIEEIFTYVNGVEDLSTPEPSQRQGQRPTSRPPDGVFKAIAAVFKRLSRSTIARLRSRLGK